MLQPGQLARNLAKLVGSAIHDVESRELLGKAIVFCWRGRIYVIGYTGRLPLRPVVVPSKRLTYWKTTFGFTGPSEPDFENIR